MTPPQATAVNERAIFADALDFPVAADRAAFLEQACAGDADLQRRVESLIDDVDHLGNFLDQPALVRNGAVAPASLAEAPGTIIGHYKLLEQIGEGGMGLVFMAEQTEPIRRKVALKIIKPGMDTRQVVARFEAERQALAMMDHPNIAKILDAGTVDPNPPAPFPKREGGEDSSSPSPLRGGGWGEGSGRPYFVMELVRGVPITEFCDTHRYTPKQRLALFVTVCQAVQHAHQKGIIHRDLKPSNILVTLHDTVAVPKIIDFGIAKALDHRLTERTLFTNFAQMIGTPVYMSPEQAEMNGLDADTRSDVYALGVLLYELLTGTTPFDSQKLKQVGFDEMRRLIREEDPPRPSQRVSTLEAAALTTLSEQRGVDGRRFSATLRGDLDWIVLKALEKDRNRRYESAGALAADVQRYLNDEPVEACPPTALCRLGKWGRRNRAMVASVTAILLVAALAVSGSVGWIAKDRADRKQAAQLAATESLDQCARSERLGRWPDALASAQRAVDLLSESPGENELAIRACRQRDMAALVLRVDEIRLEIASGIEGGSFNHSVGNRRLAEAFRDIGIDPDSLPPDETAMRAPQGPARVELAAALDDWARIRRHVEKNDDRGWRRLLVAADAVDANPWTARVRDAWARSDAPRLRELAGSAPFDRLHPSATMMLTEKLRGDEAVALLREAQRHHPGDFWLNHQLAFRLAKSRPARPGEAIGFYRAALAVRPESPGVLLNLGQALTDVNRLDEAIQVYRQAIQFKPDYSNAHSNLGTALARKGLMGEAEAAFRDAIIHDSRNAVAYYNLGKALYIKGQFEGAVAAYRESLQIRPRDVDTRSNLGNSLRKLGAIAEAEAEYREVLRHSPRHAGANAGLGGILCDNKRDYDGAIVAFRRAIEAIPDNPLFHAILGNALSAKGAYGEAADAYRESIRLEPRNPAWHKGLAKVLHGSGDSPGAIVEFRKAIQLKPDDADAHHELGIVLMAKSRDEAESAFRKAVLRKPDLVESRINLANILREKGDIESAIAQMQEVSKLKPDDARVHIVLSQAHYAKRDWNAAAASAHFGISLQSKSPEAHCHLGLALLELGRYREALTELRVGHELGSKNPDWKHPSAEWVRKAEVLVAVEELARRFRFAVPW